jgi:hypothetical protein
MAHPTYSAEIRRQKYYSYMDVSRFLDTLVFKPVSVDAGLMLG